MTRAVVLGCLLLVVSCASTAKEDAADPLAAIEDQIEFSGNEAVSRRDLVAAARRELRSYAEHGRRPADAADAAYSMELLLREQGFAHGVVVFYNQ